MAVSVTNSTILLYNTITTLTANAATSSVIDAAEVFTITPTKKDSSFFIEFRNGPTHGTVTYSIAVGEFWAAPSSALTGSVLQDVTRGIILESAKYKTVAGTIVITFTPASGKRLLTDHAFKVYCTELPS